MELAPAEIVSVTRSWAAPYPLVSTELPQATQPPDGPPNPEPSPEPRRVLSLRSDSRPPVVTIRASTPSGTTSTMFDAPPFMRIATSPLGFGTTNRIDDAPTFTWASVTCTSDRSTSNSPAPTLTVRDVGT